MLPWRPRIQNETRMFLSPHRPTQPSHGRPCARTLARHPHGHPYRHTLPLLPIWSETTRDPTRPVRRPRGRPGRPPSRTRSGQNKLGRRDEGRYRRHSQSLVKHWLTRGRQGGHRAALDGLGCPLGHASVLFPSLFYARRRDRAMRPWCQDCRCRRTQPG